MFSNQRRLRAFFGLAPSILARLLALLVVALPGSKVWAADQRALLALSVNGIDCGTVLAVVRLSDVLLPVDDLTRAGLNLSSAKRETIGNTSFVSLAALAPAFSYVFDQKKLSVAVTASAASFKPTSVDLANGGPSDMVFRSDPAAFFNYSATTSNLDSVSGFFEGGITVDHLLFYSGLLLVDTSSLVRGLTNITWDDPTNLRRFIVGGYGAGGASPWRRPLHRRPHV